MLNLTHGAIENASLDKLTGCCRHLDTFFSSADSDIILLSDTIVCVLNAVFSFVAVFANIIILYALCKASSLHSPSKALLCSLALSDLGVGAIVQPLFVAYRWAHINDNLPVLCTAGIISHIEGSHFSAVSFLTMTAISLDRLLALLLRVQYQSVVTLKRVLVVLAAIWIGGGLWASTWTRNQNTYTLVSIIYIPICFSITFVAYLKIYFCLRKQACKMGKHVNPLKCIRNNANDMNFSRYKKSVVSMFYLFCAFLVSFLPYLCHKVAVSISGWCTSTSVLFSFALTMVYINSSLNPLIYCWRISELKQIVVRVFCRCRERSVVTKVKYVSSRDQVKILSYKRY
ncbi:hypothetical protein OS493_003079 [Desmophyllum pertusum]|uniref:G-protein coupled receptors family 1 profile domain-containing protein n=1 Tax=Desmophyllum pertusum TaxID=174260 RepID=A0A9W9YGH9_9CNID|nr:hypothetical protein OS493_003079 [Desmophyllum pertusum]